MACQAPSSLFLPEAAASGVIDELCRLPVVSTDADLVRRAITTSRRWQLAVWDALIVEAARSSACDRILTEDLQDSQDFSRSQTHSERSPLSAEADSITDLVRALEVPMDHVAAVSAGAVSNPLRGFIKLRNDGQSIRPRG